MHKSLSRCCSLVLVLAILINLLPVHVLALEDEAQTENVNSGNVADTEPVQILGEVVENRGEYTKEYILSNGLHIATVYSEPVHYEENGQWLEIDNTLCAAVRGDGDVYTNAAGDWSVSFPQQLSGDSYVSVERNGYRLRFALAGAVHTSLDKDLVIASDDMTLDEDTIALHEMTPASAHIQEPDLTAAMESAEYPELIQAKSHSRVEYTDVFVNTDIVYDLTGGQLKESIVIQGYAETLYGYQYVLDMGEPVSIVTLAERVGECLGLPVQMAFTGLRDGEKLTEELFCDSPTATADPLIFKEQPPHCLRADIDRAMALFDAAQDDAAAMRALYETVAEYKKEEA